MTKDTPADVVVCLDFSTLLSTGCYVEVYVKQVIYVDIVCGCGVIVVVIYIYHIKVTM